MHQGDAVKKIVHDAEQQRAAMLIGRIFVPVVKLLRMTDGKGGATLSKG